jgi:isopentenyldiphosphate isomerase
MKQTTQPDEQYEILDENGAPTGEVLDRKEVHAKELWHGVVNVWVVNSQGEILLQLRAPGVELCPGVWDVAMGTHLRAGEAPIDAAQRGLKTELGLVAAPEELKHMFNILSANPTGIGMAHRVFGHVFLLQRDVEPEEFKIDPRKISRLAWKPLPLLISEIGSSETKDQYFPRTRNYYPQLFEALQGMTGGVQY